MLKRTSFLQSQTVIRSLEFALAKGGFGGDEEQKKTAQALLKEMRSARSLSGRHQQLSALLKKGASVDEMIKATSSSRRTVFRYLNHLEEAGLGLELSDGKYRLT